MTFSSTTLANGGTERDPLVECIDALLPQTQCTKCGYPGCRPYAEAIAAGTAAINQCPPGGEAGVHALAELLGREAKPLNPEHGAPRDARTVAWIDEDSCIGCTKCIQACPVDAILGARRQMHTVLREECTGCDLCVEPCPVDCIHMLPAGEDSDTWPPERAALARERHDFRERRLAREARETKARRERRKAASPERAATGDASTASTSPGRRVPSVDDRKATIAAALVRMREKKRRRADASANDAR